MTDAHCHPRDLLEYQSSAEDERLKLQVPCAANACTLEQFEYNENLARKSAREGGPLLLRCFALHPQLSSHFLKNEFPFGEDFSLSSGLELLRSLASDGRIDVIGETGFDLYDAEYRAGEKLQDEMFEAHLDIALRYDLPVIMHVRRAMHKVFPFSLKLKKLPAVIFHNWPGTRGEGEAFLRKGINAFFSFGSAIILNHRQAMNCAAFFPPDRLLLETDAPYQPLRGKNYSTWQDLFSICSGMAALRKEAGSQGNNPEEIETLTTANFFRAFARPS